MQKPICRFFRPTFSGWLILFIALPLSCFLLSLATEAAADRRTDRLTERPNIVLFLVDDMGVMDTSVPFLTDSTGATETHPLNQFFRTPSMERMAQQGIRFNQFYAMSVCSPTRVSIMTGQNAARHRTTNWIHPYQNNRGPRGPHEWNWEGLGSNQMTIARALQQSGYRTIHIGKGHFGQANASGADPTTIGFDVNIAGSAIGHPGSYSAEKNYGAGTSNPVPHLEKYHGSDIHLTDALTREAKIQMSAAAESNSPFFLYLSHYAVHTPFESDSRFRDNYTNSGRSPQAQNFATLIEGMDHSLGQVLDHLEELGIAENTLVLFLGDNGTDAPLGDDHGVACAAPLRGRKGTQYEGGVRTPLMAAWAKPNAQHPLQKQLPIAKGAIQSQVATILDLFPTVLEAAKIDLPVDHPLDGSSLRRLLTGQRDPSRPEEFLMHFPHQHRDFYFTTLRQGDWKVIYHYFPQDKQTERQYQLFNLKTDRDESDDLSVSHPDQLDTMMRALIERLEQYDALYPVDDEGGAVKPLMPNR